MRQRLRDGIPFPLDPGLPESSFPEDHDLSPNDLVRETEAPRDRIALVGLRGAGKSTLGQRLALRLEVPFVELDQRVRRGRRSGPG